MSDEFELEDEVCRGLETEQERLDRQGIYGEIKRELVKLGIPAEEIAFIHDFDTPAKKALAFAKANAGWIRVMLASTEKLAYGANLQERLYAIHHGDAAWRPSDIEQREGRLLRPGNKFPEVCIFNYVTEGSFDGFIWQTLENKARFISQIMSGEVTARATEDVDDMVMTAAQVKAIASGNPRILERVSIEVELTRLSRLYTVWRNGRRNLKWELELLPERIREADQRVAEHKQANLVAQPPDRRACAARSEGERVMRETTWIIDTHSGQLTVEGLRRMELEELAADLLPAGEPVNCARPINIEPLRRSSTRDAEKESTVRVFRIYHKSVVEGPGRRSVAQFSGCEKRCPGRHAVETHPIDSGVEMSVAEIVERLLAPEGEPRDGVTILGGEPLLQPKGLLPLMQSLKHRDQHITLYTGYTLEELTGRNDQTIGRILELTDILIDGPFVKELSDNAGEYVGSRNQRKIFRPALHSPINLLA